MLIICHTIRSSWSTIIELFVHTKFPSKFQNFEDGVSIYLLRTPYHVCVILCTLWVNWVTKLKVVTTLYWFCPCMLSLLDLLFLPANNACRIYIKCWNWVESHSTWNIILTRASKLISASHPAEIRGIPNNCAKFSLDIVPAALWKTQSHNWVS